MPVIFASSVIFFPATIAQFTKWEWLGKASAYVSPQTHFWVYVPGVRGGGHLLLLLLHQHRLQPR